MDDKNKVLSFWFDMQDTEDVNGEIAISSDKLLIVTRLVQTVISPASLIAKLSAMVNSYRIKIFPE